MRVYDLGARLPRHEQTDDSGTVRNHMGKFRQDQITQKKKQKKPCPLPASHSYPISNNRVHSSPSLLVLSLTGKHLECTPTLSAVRGGMKGRTSFQIRAKKEGAFTAR